MPIPTPSLPAPRTWSAGDLVTTPRLRADVANAIAFLAQKPLFVGQNSLGSSWSSGADNNLGLNVEIVDNWNGHATGSQVAGAASSQYFAPVPGWYLVRSRVSFAAFGPSPQQAAVIGGFNWTTGGSAQPTSRGAVQAVYQTVSMFAEDCNLIEQTVGGPVGGSGDWIQPTAFQGIGAPLALATGAMSPTVSVRWVCATSGTSPLPVPPLTGVPSPITAAWLNANVRDATRFLAYPPIFKGIYPATGGNSLASSTFPAGNVVPITTSVVDNYAGFGVTVPAGWTAPVAGRYFVYGHYNLAAAGVTTAYYAGLAVNAGTTQWGDGSYNDNSSVSLAGGATVGMYLRLNAGDYVTLMACQGSGGSINYTNVTANQPRLICVWTGA